MKICYDYLRPRKAELMKQRYALYEQAHRAEISEVEDATVVPAFYIPEGRMAGVVDDNNVFCTLSEDPDMSSAVEEKAKASKPCYEDSTVAYMGYFNPHWGHFITDCLSTFWILDKIEVEKFVFSFDEDKTPEICANIREALELLGVWNRIEIVNRPKKYSRVFVPSRGMMPRSYILPETETVYERIIAAALDGNSDESQGKILMSRANFPKAKKNDLGSAEVENIFVANGYKAVYPERISLRELIRLLHGAEETVAISGTLMHNMLFAPKGSKLTVIEKYANINNYQQGIDRLKDLRVTYIDAFYLIYSVDPGFGPFVIRKTDELGRFMEDRKMKAAVSERSYGYTLRRYFKLYFRHYKRQWILPDWLEEEIGLLREAYASSEEVLSPWLKGQRLLYFRDLLNPRLISGMIKRLKD